LARKVYKKSIKWHYRDNIEYHDILTHDDRHQLFLMLSIPNISCVGNMHNTAYQPTRVLPTLVGSGRARPPLWTERPPL